jgi:hypothetical protein
MNKTLATLACCLLLATAIPMSSADELPSPVAMHQEIMESMGDPLPGPTPTHPGLGNDNGCKVSGDVFSYGAPGTPAGPCNTFAYNNHAITHSAINCAAYCYSVAYGFDQTTWAYGYFLAECVNGARGLIDWTTTPPTATFLTGTCVLAQYNNPGTLPWYSYGWGQQGVTFSWADNVVDAVLHL